MPQTYQLGIVHRTIYGVLGMDYYWVYHIELTGSRIWKCICLCATIKCMAHPQLKPCSRVWSFSWHSFPARSAPLLSFSPVLSNNPGAGGLIWAKRKSGVLEVSWNSDSGSDPETTWWPPATFVSFGPPSDAWAKESHLRSRRATASFNSSTCFCWETCDVVNPFQ